MQNFTFLLLVASVALMGVVLPVEATRLVKRETNAQRFARHLAPNDPAKRSHTDTVKRSQFSQRQSSRVYTGTLQVQYKNGTVLGSASNNVNIPSGLSLNLASNPDPTDPNLVVSFEDGNLVAQDPAFPPPYDIGAGLEIHTQGQPLDLIQFTNAEEGSDGANIWSLDSSNSGQLTATATWDNSEAALTILYHTLENSLYFTDTPEDVSPPLVTVHIYLAQVQ
ncbi:hypothetical protein V8E53_009424 [Lactarius tabidus]